MLDLSTNNWAIFIKQWIKTAESIFKLCLRYQNLHSYQLHLTFWWMSMFRFCFYHYPVFKYFTHQFILNPLTDLKVLTFIVFKFINLGGLAHRSHVKYFWWSIFWNHYFFTIQRFVRGAILVHRKKL